MCKLHTFILLDHSHRSNETETRKLTIEVRASAGSTHKSFDMSYFIKCVK